jgi:hypothetical protein
MGHSTGRNDWQLSGGLPSSPIVPLWPTDAGRLAGLVPPSRRDPQVTTTGGRFGDAPESAIFAVCQTWALGD